MNYQIFRPTSGAPILVAAVAPRGTQTRRAMGFDYVDMNFEVPEPIDFQIGDTVVVYGRNYKLNRFKPLGYVKKGKRHYAYELQFESYFYDTAKVQFRGLGATNQLTEAQVNIRATAATMVDLLVRNLNRVQSGWQVGQVDTTEMHDFSFRGENCLQVLNNLADTFKSEFWIDNQIIHFQKREQSSGLVLKLGADEALYEVSLGQRNDADLVTRLYAEGGSRNLPKNYGKPALQLPVSVGPYLDAPGAKEIIEHTEIFADIIPERIGSVTSIGTDIFTFSDSSLNFDINANLMPGKKAKIGFQTGSLGGLEFEIESYNNVSKTFKLVLKTDEAAYPNGLPNSILKPAIGDKYALFDIDLPQTYVTDAENRVLVAAQGYIAKYSQIQYEYGALIKPLWVKQTNPNITLGYSVKLVDSDSDIDKTIRISGYSRDLQEPALYDLELSNTIQIAEIVRQYAKQDKLDQAISAGVIDVERVRRQWAATEELTIMLETLQAEMLLIIAEGGNYSTTIVAETNAEGDANKFKTTAGIVQHDQYTENGGLWNVSDSDVTLASAAPYYVYVKASKADQSASVVYSLVKIGVEDVSGFYHFPFGVLSSVLGGIRIFSSTKGYTRITGNDVQTGRIVSNDGTVWIDLNNSQIKFGEVGNGLDWGVTQPGQLTVDGHIVARSGNIGGYEIDPLTGKLQISLQKVTEAGATSDRIITVKGTENLEVLTIPPIGPLEPKPDMFYLHFGELGQGSVLPPPILYLEDLQNVADVIPNNKFLFKGVDGIWSGVDVPIPDLSGYAKSDGSNATGTWNINVPSWTGQYYDPTVTASANLMMGHDGATWKPMQASGVRAFLGIPSGGDTLQSVMSRGAETSTNFYFSTRDRAIVFGALDTQIYSRTNGVINIYTGGSDSLSIYPSGNIASRGAMYAYGDSKVISQEGQSYYQVDTWLQLNGSFGLYAPNNNGAHLLPNNFSSYGTWLVSGNKGGYGGVVDSFSIINFGMYDSSGKGGDYDAYTNNWIYFYNRSDKSISFVTNKLITPVIISTGALPSGKEGIDLITPFDSMSVVYNGTAGISYGLQIITAPSSGNTYFQSKYDNTYRAAYDLIMQSSGGGVGVGINAMDKWAKFQVGKQAGIYLEGTITLTYNSFYAIGLYTRFSCDFKNGQRINIAGVGWFYVAVGNDTSIALYSDANLTQLYYWPYATESGLNYSADTLKSFSVSSNGNTEADNFSATIVKATQALAVPIGSPQSHGVKPTPNTIYLYFES